VGGTTDFAALRGIPWMSSGRGRHILDWVAGKKRKHLTIGIRQIRTDACMFYGLAKGLIPKQRFEFEHILQDIQTLNERGRAVHWM